jgi:hypothetical protein
LRPVVAHRPDQFDAAYELVARRYAARGYRISHLVKCCASGNPDPHSITLLAQDGDQLLGTLTLRAGFASPLLAESSYSAEIERLRSDGHRVGELVRLVVKEGADWRAALDVLVESAYVVNRAAHALTHVVIEVNPRHVSFYRRVFGFVVASTERFCSRVEAPSVLLLLDLELFARKRQLSPPS